MEWKVYYYDGTTYVGPLEEVPIYNVLVIGQSDPQHGRKLVMGGDYYIFDDVTGWVSCDSVTVWQYMARPGLKKVLLGVMADEERWQETVKRARQDTLFPEQTALHLFERRDEFEA
jgi:hypothetical protein